MSAQRALNHIAGSPEGAQALVDADMFGSLTELLNSWYGEIRKGTAELLWTLATHDFGLRHLSNLCTQLVSELRRVPFPICDLDADVQPAKTRYPSLWVRNEP